MLVFPFFTLLSVHNSPPNATQTTAYKRPEERGRCPRPGQLKRGEDSSARRGLCWEPLPASQDVQERHSPELPRMGGAPSGPHSPALGQISEPAPRKSQDLLGPSCPLSRAGLRVRDPHSPTAPGAWKGLCLAQCSAVTILKLLIILNEGTHTVTMHWALQICSQPRPGQGLSGQAVWAQLSPAGIKTQQEGISPPANCGLQALLPQTSL